MQSTFRPARNPGGGFGARGPGALHSGLLAPLEGLRSERRGRGIFSLLRLIHPQILRKRPFFLAASPSRFNFPRPSSRTPTVQVPRRTQRRLRMSDLSRSALLARLA